MSTHEQPDRRIASFFAQPQPDLPDRVFDAVRREIADTRQRRVVVWDGRPTPALVPRLALAAALIAAFGVAALRLGTPGPGGVSGSPAAVATEPPTTPTPAPIETVGASRAAASGSPTRFISPLYEYALTLPTGWVAAPAVVRWDGIRQPGPDAEVDKLDGPDELNAFGFAGPTTLDLAGFVDDRIGANERDHADTCPPNALEFNEPASVGGVPAALLGWNCGALINQALVVHQGIAYAFTFRDLAISSARDPADRAIFQSILDSIQLPPAASPRP